MNSNNKKKIALAFVLLVLILLIILTVPDKENDEEKKFYVFDISSCNRYLTSDCGLEFSDIKVDEKTNKIRYEIYLDEEENENLAFYVNDLESTKVVSSSAITLHEINLIDDLFVINYSNSDIGEEVNFLEVLNQYGGSVLFLQGFTDYGMIKGINFKEDMIELIIKEYETSNTELYYIDYLDNNHFSEIKKKL